jgi:hypothetical protein
VVIVIALLLIAALAVAQEYDMSRYTLDGGGVMHSMGGSFELSGTIGQPDASGPMIGRSFELTGGFWFEVPPGDCNSDAGVDLHDHADFEGCMAGPRSEPPYAFCPCFDRDGDRDVDLADYAILQWMQGGP